MYSKIKLPKRMTSGSAGYDFFSPFDFQLIPDDVIKIPTGIKVLIDKGWFLACYPRSGLGFKYAASLYNTTGIIDSDYSGAANEGHIFCKLCNRSLTKNSEVRVRGKKITEISEEDLFARYLEGEWDDIYSFEEYRQKFKQEGVEIVPNKTIQIMTVAAGEGFMQGIFQQFGITYDDQSDIIRNGGMGSTTGQGRE